MGKSSTINHFFGRKVASISNSMSETKATKEYTATIDDRELGIRNLTLGIVDTPGLNDTEVLDQDAYNQASIKKFMKTHKPLQHLSHKYRCHVFPNVVLLLINAADKRFEGTNSSLAKSLSAIKTIGLVDTKNNNLLIVLTNVMSCGNGKSRPENWKKHLESKSKKIQRLVERTLLVSPEVVWVENHFYVDKNDCPDYLKSVSSSKEDFDDEDGHELPKVGQWTVLPDGTKQILNLHEGIVRMLRANGDNLGLHTINTFFGYYS